MQQKIKNLKNKLFPSTKTKVLGHFLLGKEFSQTKLTVTSNSMYPTIKVGDQVILKPCQPTELQEKDIIVFLRFNKPVVHRLVKIALNKSKTVFFEQGDNQNKAHKISPKATIGKVVKILTHD